jgi:hypothetical protein
MTTLAVLLPGPLGYHLFVRTPRDRLRHYTALVAPEDLAATLWPLADPLLVVLVGTRHLDNVTGALQRFADVLGVPEAWLRCVPRRALAQRAQVAARIATAHVRAPLVQHLARNRVDQMYMPF